VSRAPTVHTQLVFMSVPAELRRDGTTLARGSSCLEEVHRTCSCTGDSGCGRSRGWSVGWGVLVGGAGALGSQELGLVVQLDAKLDEFIEGVGR